MTVSLAHATTYEYAGKVYAIINGKHYLVLAHNGDTITIKGTPVR